MMYEAQVWVYIQTEPRLWTVGFYDPEGKWHPDSEHDGKISASKRVHYLNGGSMDEVVVEMIPDPYNIPTDL